MEYLTVKDFKQFVDNQRRRGKVFTDFLNGAEIEVDDMPLVIRTITRDKFTFFNETRSTVKTLFIGTPIKKDMVSELVIFNIDYSAETYCTVGDIYEAFISNNVADDTKIVAEMICSNDENFLADAYVITFPKSSVDMMIANNKFLVIEKIYPTINEMKIDED